MEQAVKYTELMEQFTKVLSANGTAEVIPGRRFDRISVDKSMRFFVDRNSWEIYGAKSVFQYNPRRWYGTLNSVSEYNWSEYYPVPMPGTTAEQAFTAREQEIVKNYKPRGRPRKNP